MTRPALHQFIFIRDKTQYDNPSLVTFSEAQCQLLRSREEKELNIVSDVIRGAKESD